jgi:hypothetical protein
MAATAPTNTIIGLERRAESDFACAGPAVSGLAGQDAGKVGRQPPVLHLRDADHFLSRS